MLSPYNKQTELLIILHHSHLSEKDGRHYAAVEAAKLGRCGTTYISHLPGISRTTIIEGAKQLLALSAPGHPPPLKGQRKPGGGRKKKTHDPDIKALLTALIEQHKAGSPTGCLLDMPSALCHSKAMALQRIVWVIEFKFASYEVNHVDKVGYVPVSSCASFRIGLSSFRRIRFVQLYIGNKLGLLKA